MDPMKRRDSMEAGADLPATAHSPFTMGRRGVESRDEVLRQVQTNKPVIIELELEPTVEDSRNFNWQETGSRHSKNCLQSPFGKDKSRAAYHGGMSDETQKRGHDDTMDGNEFFPIAKRRRSADTDNVPSVSRQCHTQLSSLCANSASDTGNPETRCIGQGSKKSLWASANAETNMSRMSASGLISPESSASDRSTESSPLQPSNNARANFHGLTWSFDNVDSLDVAHDSQSAHHGISSDLPAFHENPQTSVAVGDRQLTSLDLQQKRNELAAHSIEESQRLRAANQRRKEQAKLAADAAVSRQVQVSSIKEKQQQQSGFRGVQDTKLRTSSTGNSNDDPETIERLLDFAEQHQRPQAETKKSTRSGPAAVQERPAQPYPFSRQAADQWPTQDHHLDHSSRSVSRIAQSKSVSTRTFDIMKDHDEKRKQEERIARTVALSAHKNRVRLEQEDMEACKRALDKGFHTPDLDCGYAKKLSSKPKIRPLTVEESSRDVRKIMGTESNLAPRTPNNISPEMQTLAGSEDATQHSSQDSVRLKMSIKSDISIKKHVGDQTVLQAISQEEFDNLPNHDDTKHVPRTKVSKLFSKEETKLFIERGIAREKQKDLECIKEVFTSAAEAGSLRLLDPTDANIRRWLSDLLGFTKAILYHQKAGDSIRYKIQGIRDGFRRRIKKSGNTPKQEDTDEYLPLLLRKDLFDKLMAESKMNSRRVRDLALKCRRLTNYYHAKCKKHKAGPSSNERNLSGRSMGPSQATTLRTPSYKRRLAELQAALELHKNASQDDDDDAAEAIDLGPSHISNDDDDDVSEEDEGEALMRPSGFAKQAQITKKAVIASHQEHDVPATQQPPMESFRTTLKPHASQSLDEQLLDNMLTRQRERSHRELQGIQRPDQQMARGNRLEKDDAAISNNPKMAGFEEAIDTTDEDNAFDSDVDERETQEFDDSDIDMDGQDDDGPATEDAPPQCKRYVVKGVCHGLSRRFEDDEFILGNYLNKEKARAKALSLAVWVKDQLQKYRPDLEIDGFSESTTHTKSSIEQKVIFGDDGRVSCRAWVEEEFHDPSEEAYQKAKVQQACQAPDIWVVDWERTIKPYEQPRDDEGSDDDDISESGYHNPTGDDSVGETRPDEADVVNVPESSMNVDDQVEVAEDVSTDPNSPDNNTESSAELATVTPATSPSSTQTTTKDTTMIEEQTEYADDKSPTVPEEDNDMVVDEPEPVHILTHPTTSPRPTSSPPLTSLSPTLTAPPLITRATLEQARLFSSPAHANRHAKDIFMRWFIDRLHGRHNIPYISQCDEEMEDELRAIGNRTTWSRNEDFVRDVVKENGEVGGWEGKVRDELRVWVRRKRCFGPGN